VRLALGEPVSRRQPADGKLLLGTLGADVARRSPRHGCVARSPNAHADGLTVRFQTGIDGTALLFAMALTRFA
jgi:hypothetical protein